MSIVLLVMADHDTHDNDTRYDRMPQGERRVSTKVKVFEYKRDRRVFDMGTAIIKHFVSVRCNYVRRPQLLL